MAATETLPKKREVPVTTDSLVLPFGPILEIAESVSTQSVDIDITNSAIQEVLPSDEIELGVIAPDRKSIEKAVGQLIGGLGFLYELYERRELKGYYFLRVISLIGPLQIMPFAEALQGISHRITIYVEGNIVSAF